MDWRNSNIPIAYQPVYNLGPVAPNANTEYYPDYHELQSLSSQRPGLQSFSSQQPLLNSHDSTATVSHLAQQARHRASAWQRFSPLLAAVCAASLSTAPAALYFTGQSFGVGSYLYDVTLNHRTSEQVAVGILASVFSWLWAYALCMSFNLLMRVWLSGKNQEMDLLRLYASISRQAVDLNLSWRYLVLSAGFIGVLLIQSWLWQGALTPDLKTVTRMSNISVVRTGGGSYDFGDAMYIPAFGGIYVNCTRVTQTNGTFTNCPGRELAGAIVDAINTAGNVEGVPRNHSKPDNSGYTYVGRSYGVGAGVGLMAEPNLGNIEGYTYSELGYRTDSTCIYNESASWDLENRFTDNDGGTPNLFLVNGDRPNDPVGEGGALGNGYVVPSFGTEPDTVVAVTAGSCCGSKVGDPPYYVSVFGGNFYNFLDKIQCAISFIPTRFDIAVSVDNRTISVSSQRPNGTDTVEDPEPRGALKEWTLRGLQSLTMVQTTLYMSTPGEAFINTVVNQMNNNTFDPRGGAVPEVLPAIKSSMDAAIDTILLSLGGFSLTQAGGSDRTPAEFHVRAVQIGSRGFIIAILVTNAVALFATFTISIWTLFFDDSPAFDFSDMGAMVAGVVLGQEQTNADQGLSKGSLVGWTGDSRDDVIQKLRLEIDSKLGTQAAPFVKMK